MDPRREKLKNRLNLKFEPSLHRESLKKLTIDRERKDKDSSIVSKNRSISNVRLPSLDKRQFFNEPKLSIVELKSHQTLESMEPNQSSKIQPLNLKQLRTKIKSLKIVPQVRVESSAPIYNTLTYLIQNQILTIPKIVEMLQKSSSQQFMYMRVIGIYEYEVCSQANKGTKYITVSRNGMVTDSGLITLEELVRQFQIYRKLKRIQFFRNYAFIKFMNKWNRGSKKANFIDRRLKLKKQLNLENEHFAIIRKDLRGLIYHNQGKQGSLNSSWVGKLPNLILEERKKVEEKLIKISYQTLNKYQLPISQSAESLNKILTNLSNLNLTFEKKIKIQKEMEIIYKLGRMLEVCFYTSIGDFVVQHLSSLIEKFSTANEFYKINALQKLQVLNLNDQKYNTERDTILINLASVSELNFQLQFDNFQLSILPKPAEVHQRLLATVKQFILGLQKQDLKIIRTSNFAFILTNIMRNVTFIQQKQITVRDYIYFLSKYSLYLEELEAEIAEVQRTVVRRLNLLSPFFQIYNEVTQKSIRKDYINFGFEDMRTQLFYIEQKISFCQSKLHDGENFLIGYLSLLSFKDSIISSFHSYKQELTLTIPKMIKTGKTEFYKQLNFHQAILSNPINSAENFIIIYQQCEFLEEKMMDYTAKLLQLERLQDLYISLKKIETFGLGDQKASMTQLRSRLKNFRDLRENAFLVYRKQTESLKNQIISKILTIKIDDESFKSLSDEPSLVLAKLRSFIKDLNTFSKELKHINFLQQFFSLKKTMIPKLSVLDVEASTLLEIWQIYSEWVYESEKINNSLIMDIESKKNLIKWQNFARKIQRLAKNIEYEVLCKHLNRQMALLLEGLYLVNDLQTPHLRKQDYLEIEKLFQKELQIYKKNINQIKFFQFQNHSLVSLRVSLQQIVFRSRKEQQIEEILKKFNIWWRQLRLEGQSLEQYPLIVVFSQNEHVRREIQDQTTILLNITNHKYGTFVRKQCQHSLRLLSNLGAMLELAVVHQQRFLALFPILTTKYAEKQLSNQYKRFQGILSKTMKNVKLLFKPTENLNEQTKSLLNGHIKQFDTISKILSSFLEKKRVKFQRFYFLQDQEMLEVLVGIAGDCNVFRMFEGIKAWLVDLDGIKCGVYGIGDERLLLKGWSYKNMEPEVIFKGLEEAIRQNLNSIVRNTLHSYENQLKQLKNLYHKIPWMCIYTVETILFTKQVELNCFQNRLGLQTQAALILQTINSYSSEPSEHANILTLQLSLLHFVDQMRQQHIDSVFDFQWYSFLRFYHDKDTVVMRAFGSEYNWGGQYQGRWSLMINTSDIRRAHACVLVNLKFGNGVLLQGPSGTGKTESLKELARCMGKYCVLFNCSNEVDMRTLQKLLSGLCYTASWLCLDQINRLTAEIMSVVGNQINTIKNAVVQGKQMFNFSGKVMKLKKGVGIFATMNPIYLKRAKLTQNLKSYFRVISVNTPDYQKILEVMLYSLNISSPNENTKKISSLFKNLSITLNEHPQYDFGLRTMKIFVHYLSEFKNDHKKDSEAIVSALMKTFHGRLESEDQEVFSKSVYDTFGIKNKDLNNNQNQKVQWMFEAPQTGLIVIGKTSAKSTIIKKFCELFPNSKITLFNPCSMEMPYFLGQNVLGRWQQGIVEKVARESSENSSNNNILILDSQLKSQTIQNFNSLLDDSKLLSLSNGTRLKVHSNFRIVMETVDLAMTSPATITRCHVVYVSEADVDREQILRQSLPNMSCENYKRLSSILMKLSLKDLRMIVKIYPMLTREQIKLGQKGEFLSEGDIIGLEKAIIYTCQLLSISDQIKQFIHKDNSVSAKKNAFNFELSFQRFIEGQFVEIFENSPPIIDLESCYVPTNRTRFMDYLNHRSFTKKISILWKANPNTGKSTTIMHSIIKRESKIMKIPLDRTTSSAFFINLLEEKIFNRQATNKLKSSDFLLVYVDNLHMGNQQITQYVRFLAEYKKTFTFLSKAITSMPPFCILADADNVSNMKYESRLGRHFAEIELPECESEHMKQIFVGIISHLVEKSQGNSQFKESLSIDAQRIGSFISGYISKNNQFFAKNSRKQQKRGYENIERINFLSLANAIKSIDTFITKKSQIQDLIAFLLFEIKCQSNNQDQVQLLSQTFTEIFKHKYQHQNQKVLKKSVLIADQIKYIMDENGDIKIIDKLEQFTLKVQKTIPTGYYISKNILVEVVRILRIINWRKGNYFLVGPKGIGKRTILKIAAHISQKQFHEFKDQIEEKKISQWYFKIVRKVLQTRKPQIVLVSAQNASIQNKFLTFYERVLSGYPIKNYLSNEQADFAYSNIEQLLDQNYQKSMRPFSEVVRQFLRRINSKIHIFMHSSPSRAQLLLQDYHFIAKDTTVRLLDDFPAESIIQISTRILSTNPDLIGIGKRLTGLFLSVYNLINDHAKLSGLNGLTHFKHNPFIHFKTVRKFIQIFNQSHSQTKDEEDIINRSIIKVHQTAEIFEKLKMHIKQMQPQVKLKRLQIIDFVELLEKKKQKSQETKAVLIAQKKQIEVKRIEIQKLMKQVEEKIRFSQPLLQQVNDSISTVKRQDLSELKSSANPHSIVKFMLECMVLLLGESQSLDNIKKVLSDPNLIIRIKNCLPPLSQAQKVKKKIEENSQWNIQNVSKVAYGTRFIFKWINGLIKFVEMKTSIDQEKGYVEEIKKQLVSSVQKAEENQKQFATKQQGMKVIESEHTNKKLELAKLQEVLQNNQRRLQNAQKIRRGLQQEVQNWQTRQWQIKEFKKCSEAHSLMITFFLDISPSLQAQQQQTLEKQLKACLKRWQFGYQQSFSAIKHIKRQLSVQKAYSSMHQQLNLHKTSLEDSKNEKIILALHHLANYPILLDPDSQALNWIESQLPPDQQNLQIVKQSFGNAKKNVQTAMIKGQILILLFQDNLDSFSREVLKIVDELSEICKTIQYNKNMVRVNNNFRILFCNKSRSPDIQTALYIDHPVINFQVTLKMLHDNLMLQILMEEDYDSYVNHRGLELERKKNRESFLELERQIIHSLINNKKSLVDDNDFITLLSNSESKSQHLKKSQQELKTKMDVLEKSMHVYFSICRKCAILFTSLQVIGKINLLCNWNMSIFKKYFALACKKSISIPLFNDEDDEQDTQDNQAKQILGNYRFDKYENNLTSSRVSSALSYASQHQDMEKNQDHCGQQQDMMNNSQGFEQMVNGTEMIVDLKKKGTMSQDREHTIMFHMIDFIKNALNEDERLIWAILVCTMLRGQKAQQLLKLNEKSKRKINDQAENNQFSQNLVKFFKKYRDQLDNKILQILSDESLFQKCNDQLSSVDLLSLAKIFKPSSFKMLAIRLIRHHGMNRILQYDELQMADYLKRSDNCHPILLIMGQDPTQKLTEYLSRKRCKNVIMIAMGENQNKVVEVVLEKESKKQNIVIIHNLHINQQIHPLIAKTLQQFQLYPPHRHFRLILISRNESLSSELTAYCDKYIFEQPQGLKNQMKYLQKNFLNHNVTTLAHQRLNFTLAYFHSFIAALLQFQPFGWTISYQFSTFDFTNGVKLLKEAIDAGQDIDRYECNIDMDQLKLQIAKRTIDLQAIKYLIGEVNYVGKLADEVDREKMRVYIQKYLNEQALHGNQGNLVYPNTFIDEEIHTAINSLSQNDPKIFGLHPEIRPKKSSPTQICSKMAKGFYQTVSLNPKQTFQTNRLKQIPLVGHKLNIINKEIKRYNENIKEAHKSIQFQRLADQGKFLTILDQNSRLFDLRSFSNPREFFINVRKDFAIKNQLNFDQVELQWALTIKQQVFGITNLKLESASIDKNANGANLDSGLQQEDVTLYLCGAAKKKQQINRKRLVEIPIYLNSERQGRINSYGDNTNLLIKAKLDSQHSQEFWILRSAAFVVNS